ncbi:MAG: DUF6273 domain-containing protein, partial [Lactococcus garvieae]
EGDVAADHTQVVLGGTARAFALSLADVSRLSGPDALGWWWLRTPATSTYAWHVFNGNLHGNGIRTAEVTSGGVRPALIINPN